MRTLASEDDIAQPVVTWIERVAASDASVLVATNFDGTLTPIVPDPDRVHLGERARDVLRALTATPRVQVAILSGRTLADVVPRVERLGPLWLSADHGAVIIDPLRRMRLFDREIPNARLALLKTRVDAIAGRVPGAHAEAKTHGVTLHFREVRDNEVDPLVDAFRAAALDAGAEILHGRRIVEARFATHDKGGALARILEALPPETAVIYAGDDVTDARAFEVVRARAIGLALFVRSAELPQPTTEVSATLDGPEAWLDVLETIAAALGS